MLFEPDRNLRNEIYQDSIDNLTKQFNPKLYEKVDDVTSILNQLHDYHYNMIIDIVRGVNIKDFLAFLLFQFEKSCILENKYKEQKTSAEETKFWLDRCVSFRNTICYLCELIVEKKPFESSCAEYYYDNEFKHRLWIHAEYAIEYSLTSEAVHKLYKEKYTIEIYDSDPNGSLSFNAPSDFHQAFYEYSLKVNRNIDLRAKYLKEDLDDKILSLIKSDLNDLFFQELGFYYQTYEEIIIKFLTINKPIERPGMIPCINNSHIKTISEKFNISQETTLKILDGITLRNQHFKTKSRNAWNFQQNERIRKRPLIKVKYDGNDFFLYSPEMLLDRITSMAQDIMFSAEKLPNEWKSKTIESVIAISSNKIGKWFENINIEMFKRVNILGFKPGDKIQINNHQFFKIKQDIGPPDFIGYSAQDNAIVIIECKLIDCVFEIRGVINQVNKFIGQKKSFVKQFDKKIMFLLKNI